MWLQWQRRISNSTLRSRVGVQSVEAYVYHIQLTWLGDIRRMNDNRTPIRLLSSWVFSRRPIGPARYTYGRGMVKALKAAGISIDNWPQQATDRHRWDTYVYEGLGLPEPRSKPARQPVS